MSEADIQRAVCDYLDTIGAVYYHVPNGGLRSKPEAARMKRQGVKAGVPDLCVPMARGGYHSLYIELKDKGGKPTKSQVEWVHRLRAEGMCAWVCVGVDDAITLIDWYMAL